MLFSILVRYPLTGIFLLSPYGDFFIILLRGFFYFLTVLVVSLGPTNTSVRYSYLTDVLLIALKYLTYLL